MPLFMVKRAVNWMQKGTPERYTRELGLGYGVGIHVEDRKAAKHVTGKEVGKSLGK